MKQASTDAERGSGPERPVAYRLMSGLTRALDWFDNSLQNVVSSRGFDPVHRTQSMIIMHVAMGIGTPSEIAHETGLTRQNVHHMAKQLIERGIIESTADPRDPRRSLYRLSPSSSDMRNAALEALADLERLLAKRIGAELVDGLRAALTADWGDEVSGEAELNAALNRRRRPKKHPRR